MKCDISIILNALGVKNGDFVSISNNIYYLKNNTLRYVSGDNKQYNNKHIINLFINGEDIKPYNKIVCSPNICSECPLNVLDCTYVDDMLPLGTPLDEVVKLMELEERDPEIYGIISKRLAK